MTLYPVTSSEGENCHKVRAERNITKTALELSRYPCNSICGINKMEQNQSRTEGVDDKQSQAG